ncbi:MAG TPA: DUF134 domain-containing protein, partial [Thermodesulfobacteriota bacterium]|nr:DUF134 domain-containing protein [Thermodesulfobacteriota bacterium]
MAGGLTEEGSGRFAQTKSGEISLTGYEHMLIISLMARPMKCRCVRCSPNSYYFKPRGIPLMALEEVSLRMDELEAIRLADYQGLYHEEAAAKMEISRATFGRVLNEA